MTVILGQLVYTSFRGVGVRNLKSAEVPTEIQQAFIQHVVYHYWDSLHLPRSGYRASYLHQVTLKHTLFGWLYNDDVDELHHNHVPYFICYYYSELLHAVQLENIFTCLDKGPVALINRQSLPDTLETIVAPDLWIYQPARVGVAIPLSVRDRSHVALEQRRLLDIFVPVDEQEIIIDLNEHIYKQQSALQPSVIALPMPQAPLSEQCTIPFFWGNRAQLQLDSHTSDGFVPTFPKKFALLINLGTGFASGLALIVGSYYFLRSPTPVSLVQHYPVSIPFKNTALENISLAKTLTGHSGSVWSVALSPNGQTLISGSEDKTIKVWNLNTGQLSRTLSQHSDTVRSLTLSSDGQTLASSSGDKTIKVWNLPTGKLRHILTGHSGPVWSVALSGDGQTLVSGSEDGTIKIWNLQTGELRRTLTGHSGRVFSVALSPDGQTIASGGIDTTIKIWNLQTGELLRTLEGHSDSVRFVTISPDGQKIASTSWDKTIKIWNLQTGKLLRTLFGHTQSVISVAFSFDGQTLVSASSDKTIKIWDQDTGKLLTNLSGHSDWVLSVVISPSGSTLISSSKDKTIKIWR